MVLHPSAHADKPPKSLQVGPGSCGLTAGEFDHLDRTELVHLGVYQRLAVEVAVDGEERVPAFTYRSAMTLPGRKPSPRYRGLLIEGARQHALAPDYVEYLESFELARDERVANR